MNFNQDRLNEVLGRAVLDMGAVMHAALVFDYHHPSIEVAEQRARDAGVENRVSFLVGLAQDFPGENYDLIACFDSLHDG